MNILFLETSSKNCSVAISQGEKLLCLCEEVSQNYKHSEELHVFVQWALEGAKLKIQDIDAVCLGKGPGSYTGIRIGASSAKGFCFGLNIPLVAVDSLNALATPFFQKDYDFIIPLVDARRMEVYCKVFDGSGKEIHATEAMILDENSFKQYHDSKVLLVGDGAKKAKDILTLANANYAEDQYPSAQNLIREGFLAVQNKRFEDVAYFEPFYLKDFQGHKSVK